MCSADRHDQRAIVLVCDWVARNRSKLGCAIKLRAGLARVPEMTTLAERPGIKHACHLFPIVIRIESLTVDRDTVMAALQGFRRGMFPNSEHYGDRTASLPFFPGMTDADIDDVVETVTKVITHYAA